MENLIIELTKIVVPALVTLIIALKKRKSDINDLKSGRKNINEM